MRDLCHCSPKFSVVHCSHPAQGLCLFVEDAINSNSGFFSCLVRTVLEVDRICGYGTARCRRKCKKLEYRIERCPNSYKCCLKKWSGELQKSHADSNIRTPMHFPPGASQLAWTGSNYPTSLAIRPKKSQYRRLQ